MRRVLERCAALDVHKKQLTACARTLGQGGELEDLTAEFSTMAADLLALRDWLTELGVTHVAMEATGVYWKPIYYALEDDFELLLVNAQHVKNVPGRKTDTSDAQWLCQLLECGLLRPSFVPPKPIRTLRDLTRYRKALIRERASEANRLQKTLEDAGIKLSSVATDVLGVSGRLMLDALVSGTRDPDVLAELAKGALRKKIPALKRALAGTFKPHHTLIVSHILAHLDYLDEAIANLTAEVERRLAPFARKAELLTTITGVAARNSQVILAELGPDMSRFPSDRHAASWVAICPGNDESAGKRRSGKTRRGNPHLRAALIESANAAARSKNTYLRAQYAQVKRRRGHKKAIVAVAHSILIAAYHILKDDIAYHDLGGDYFTRRADPQRIARRLVAQLERLGHAVTLQTPTAQEPVATPA
jgi:transposase